MKRNFLTAIAVMVTTFFVGTTLAQAADISFSGQLRPRFEANQQGDFNDTTNTNYFSTTRIRLNAKVKINPDTSAFIQLQSVGVWGGGSGGNGTRNAGGANGGGGGGNQASDTLNDVGLHQAYFTLKNFAGLPADLKMGRQEIVIDGHRLFGHTGWTQGAQTHDAFRLTHSEGDHTLGYTFSKGVEASSASSSGIGGLAGTGGSSAGDDDDLDTHIFYVNKKGIMGGDISGYFIFVDNEAGTDDGDFYTLGVRHKGKMYGLDYRAEYYYQGGDGAAGANGSTYSGAYTNIRDADYDAYMFGVRIGKTFKNVMWKPTITLWYDYLSGTDDDDVRSNDYGAFNTLHDTGHKFYGYMDLYLNAGGAGSDNLGLTDAAIKLKLQPRDKWTAKADMHFFHTATNPDTNGLITANNANISANNDGDLGAELDLTLIHKYNANTKLVFGFSHYWSTVAFQEISGNATAAGADDASWGYMMIDMKF